MQYLNLSSLALTTTANLLLVDQLRLLFSTSAPGTKRTSYMSRRSAASEELKLALDDPHAPGMVKMDISAIA